MGFQPAVSGGGNARLATTAPAFGFPPWRYGIMMLWRHDAVLQKCVSLGRAVPHLRSLIWIARPGRTRTRGGAPIQHHHRLFM